LRCRGVASTLPLLRLLLLAAVSLRLRRLPLLQCDLRLLHKGRLLRWHGTIRCSPLCLLRQGEPTLVIRKSSDSTRCGSLG